MFAAVTLAVSVPVYSQSQQSPAPPQATDRLSTTELGAAVETDARLAKTITASYRYVCIGELLDTVTQQTGVDFAASDRDGAAAEMIAIYAKELPASEMMQSLVALLSYRNASWYWVRSKAKSGAFAYRLVRSDTAREFPTAWDESIHTAFESEISEACKAVLDGSDDWKKGETKNDHIAGMRKYPKTFLQTQAFATSVPEDIRQKMLSNKWDKGAFVVPVSEANSAMKTLLDAEVEQINKLNPKMAFQAKSVSFVYDRRESLVAPTLMVYIKDATGTAFGKGLAGGSPWEEKCRGLLNAAWMDGGGKVSNSRQEALPIPADTQATPTPKTDFNGITREQLRALYKRDADQKIGARLEEVAAKSPKPLSIIARLPYGDEQANCEVLTGQSVGNIVKRLREYGCGAKWQNDTLLVVTPAWIHTTPEAARVPYAVRKQLKAQIATNETKAWTRDNLLDAVALLNREQLAELARTDAKVMGTPYTVFKVIADWYPVLKSLSKVESRTDAGSMQGVYLRSLSVEARERVTKALPDTVISPDARIFLFSQVPKNDPKFPSDTLSLLFRNTKDENFVSLAALFLNPQN